jgi:hypothetical protein
VEDFFFAVERGSWRREYPVKTVIPARSVDPAQSGLDEVES